jgi:hypothetical protein
MHIFNTKKNMIYNNLKLKKSNYNIVLKIFLLYNNKLLKKILIIIIKIIF